MLAGTTNSGTTAVIASLARERTLGALSIGSVEAAQNLLEVPIVVDVDAWRLAANAAVEALHRSNGV